MCIFIFEYVGVIFYNFNSLDLLAYVLSLTKNGKHVFNTPNAIANIYLLSPLFMLELEFSNLYFSIFLFLFLEMGRKVNRRKGQ